MTLHPGLGVPSLYFSKAILLPLHTLIIVCNHVFIRALSLLVCLFHLTEVPHGQGPSVRLSTVAHGTTVLFHLILDCSSFKSKLGVSVGQGPARKIENTLSISYGGNLMQGN